MSERLIDRFALIGDVHGEDGALAAVLDFLDTNGPFDAILCTGDLPGKMGVGDTDRCVELLEAVGAVTIQGNHDAWATEVEEDGMFAGFGDDSPLNPQTRDYLRQLPRTRSLETPVGPLLLCHGVGADYMAEIRPGGDDETIRQVLKEKRIYGRYRLMVAGHTHRFMVRPLGTLTIVNAGTLLWDHDPCFSIVHVSQNAVRRYSLTPFVHAIAEAELYRLFAEAE